MKLPRFSLRDLFWLVLVCALGLVVWRTVVAGNNLQQKSDLILKQNNMLYREIRRDAWKSRAEALQEYLKTEHNVQVEWEEEGLVLHTPGKAPVILPDKKPDRVQVAP